MQNNKKLSKCTMQRLKRTPKNLSATRPKCIVKRKYLESPNIGEGEKKVKTSTEDLNNNNVSSSFDDIVTRIKIVGQSIMRLCEDTLESRKRIIDIIRDGKKEDWQDTHDDDEKISKTIEELRKEQVEVMEILITKIATLVLKEDNPKEDEPKVLAICQAEENNSNTIKENDTPIDKFKEYIIDLEEKLSNTKNKILVMEKQFSNSEKQLNEFKIKLRRENDNQKKIKDNFLNEKKELDKKLKEKDKKLIHYMNLLQEERKREANRNINNLVEVAEKTINDINEIEKMGNALQEDKFDKTNIVRIISNLRILKNNLDQFILHSSGDKINTSKEIKSCTTTRCPPLLNIRNKAGDKTKSNPHIRFDQMRKEIEDLTNKLQEKEIIINETLKQYKSAEETAENNYNQIVAMEQQLLELRDKLAVKIEDNHKLNENIKLANMEIENVSNQVAFFKIEYGRLQEQRTRNEARIAILENQLDKQPSRERSFRIPFFN